MAVQAHSWRQIGTRVDVLVSGGELEHAVEAVHTAIAAADHAYSRFREDSELSIVNRSPGRRVAISATFSNAIQAALAAAVQTDGLVDPSVGRALRLMGYDRDFTKVVSQDGRLVPLSFESVPGWQAIQLDTTSHTVRVASGVELDLDSIGKALIVDDAARAAGAVLPANAGLLISIGGDIRVAGRPPRGGWRIQLSEDSDAPSRLDTPTVAIRDGALATSSTTVRRWRRNGHIVHHLVDPRTGQPCNGPWRTATAVAADCVAANTFATAAIVLGSAAPDWLEARGVPARLIANDGSITYMGGWPRDLPEAPSLAA